MLGAYLAVSLTELARRRHLDPGLLGEHPAGRHGGRRDRRAGRDPAAAPDLSRARAVSPARDFRRRADRRPARDHRLGAAGPGRPARPRPGRGDRPLGSSLPDLRAAADRARAARAARPAPPVPPHPLGHPGARRDPGPRDGLGARRQPGLAVHQRLRARRLPRSPRRRAAAAARGGDPRHGPAHHRRCLRRGGGRRHGQRRRRLSRGVADRRAVRLRHLGVPPDHPGADLPDHGGGAGGAALGPARQRRSSRPRQRMLRSRCCGRLASARGSQPARSCSPCCCCRRWSAATPSSC